MGVGARGGGEGEWGGKLGGGGLGGGGGQIAGVMDVASNVRSRTKVRQITTEDAYLLCRGL
jgi:hypothetical protein